MNRSSVQPEREAEQILSRVEGAEADGTARRNGRRHKGPAQS